MDNVIPFPTSGERSWRTIEDALLRGLGKLGMADSDRRRVTDILREYHEFLDQGFEIRIPNLWLPVQLDADEIAGVHAAIADGLASALEESLNAFKHGLFFERLDREIDFWEQGSA